MPNANIFANMYGILKHIYGRIINRLSTCDLPSQILINQSIISGIICNYMDTHYTLYYILHRIYNIESKYKVDIGRRIIKYRKKKNINKNIRCIY